MEISDNLIVTYGEVSFNKLLKVPDASFNNIGSLDNKALQIVTDASFQNNVEISGTSIFYNDASFNGKLSGTDASFGAVSIKQLMGYSPIEVMHDMSLNKRLIVPDASFNRIAPIDGSMTLIGDLSVNGNIYFSDNLYTCLLYTSPSPRDGLLSRMPSSA